MRGIAALFLIATIFPVANSQAEERVDVELVLAADGSDSSDGTKLGEQRRGYATALLNPKILSAIRSGRHRKIAVAYMEWGGPTSQHVIVDWTVISDENSAKAFAEQIVAGPRPAKGWNSISGAVKFAADMINNNQYRGTRKIIDISSDGPQFIGPPLVEVRDQTVAAGITINALAVKDKNKKLPGPRGESLELHFKTDLIGGRRAFAVVAEDATQFADAILRKMLLEVAALQIGGN